MKENEKHAENETDYVSRSSDNDKVTSTKLYTVKLTESGLQKNGRDDQRWTRPYRGNRTGSVLLKGELTYLMNRKGCVQNVIELGWPKGGTTKHTPKLVSVKKGRGFGQLKGELG